MSDKEDLLNQLKSMGYHANGRKARSDAGSKGRNYKKGRDTNLLAIYHSTIKKCAGRVQTDENGIFVNLSSEYKNVNIHYYQVFQGRRIAHILSRVKTGRELDVEKYRFNAYRELATTLPNDIVKEVNDVVYYLTCKFDMLPEYALTAAAKRNITNLDFFCELYFVEPEDVLYWTYDKWREHYDVTPNMILPEEFKFTLSDKPGTTNFHPEWSYVTQELDTKRTREAIELDEKRNAQIYAATHKGNSIKVALTSEDKQNINDYQAYLKVCEPELRDKQKIELEETRIRSRLCEQIANGDIELYKELFYGNLTNKEVSKRSEVTLGDAE